MTRINALLLLLMMLMHGVHIHQCEWLCTMLAKSDFFLYARQKRKHTHTTPYRIIIAFIIS